MSQQIHSGTRTAPSAGVAVRLSSTIKEARWIQVQAMSTNTGTVTVRGVGESGGVVMTAYGGFLFPPMGDNPHYNLKEIELVASVAGEGVNLLWYAGE